MIVIGYKIEIFLNWHVSGSQVVQVGNIVFGLTDS